MDNIMQFPETFEEFAKSYGFKDSKEIYTNGSELIPVFRVEQWLEHARAERTCHNMSDFQDCDCFICSECGEAFETARLEYDDDLFYSLNDAVHEDYYDRCDCDLNYCPNCGAKVTPIPL